MRTLKFGIEQQVFESIQACSLEQLSKWKKDLERELSQGLLKGIKYQKELELINARFNSMTV